MKNNMIQALRNLSLVGAFFTLALLCVIACQKNTNVEVEETIGIEALVKAKSEAATIHNDYLDYAYNEFTTSKSNPNFVSISVDFFKKYYPNLDVADFSNRQKVAFEKNTRNGSISLNNVKIPTELTNYVEEAGRYIETATSITDFNQKTDNILFEAKLNKKSKITLAHVIGVAQGSYAYWNSSQNRKKWTQVNRPHIQVESRACPWCIVGLADLGGAADGAAAGTLFGGVGAGPGAVMGGAIYSGLAALAL